MVCWICKESYAIDRVFRHLNHLNNGFNDKMSTLYLQGPEGQLTPQLSFVRAF